MKLLDLPIGEKIKIIKIISYYSYTANKSLVNNKKLIEAVKFKGGIGAIYPNKFDTKTEMIWANKLLKIWINEFKKNSTDLKKYMNEYSGFDFPDCNGIDGLFNIINDSLTIKIPK